VLDTCGMSRNQQSRREFWRQLIGRQEQSGLSVRAFCQQHNTSEHSFYRWRKRLAALLPVKFALVETSHTAPGKAKAIELIVPSGERLRIEPGFDAAALRAVLSVLREPR